MVWKLPMVRKLRSQGLPIGTAVRGNQNPSDNSKIGLAAAVGVSIRRMTAGSGGGGAAMGLGRGGVVRAAADGYHLDLGWAGRGVDGGEGEEVLLL
jgi:hypothetical protein